MSAAERQEQKDAYCPPVRSDIYSLHPRLRLPLTHLLATPVSVFAHICGATDVVRHAGTH